MTPPPDSAKAPPPADFLMRARELRPLIEGAADEIEHTRRLPASLVAALKEANFFRMLLPRELGGAELDPPTYVRVIETIAQAEASTAWILGQTSVTAMIAARLPLPAAREMWRDPGTVLAWGPSTDSRAVQCDGGYRVSGSFAFASGCWLANWLGGDCTIVDADGVPRRGPDGKTLTRRVLFPAAQAIMRDIWQVVGLKGTGSDGYSVADLFVPQDFTVSRIDDPAERRVKTPLYALSGYNMFAAGFGALALGVARSLVASFIALASEKTPRGFRSSLRDDGPTQYELGRAEARLRAARAFLMEAVDGAWREALRDNVLTLDARMAIRLASTHAIREAKDVADIAYDAAGTTAIFTANGFERRFRDIHTVAQQLQGRKSHFRTVGQYLLGLETDLGWI
ncbi:MAG TPA: acyl-CoA dehydrogenase family protein [Stellaceae bacterium]|nr:acyl-CoA dehydrogenase family protein [Stellaceae bacterium]